MAENFMRRNWFPIQVLGTTIIILALLILPGSEPVQAVEKEGSCVDCHRDKNFLVTNKKLYDYFQEWRHSVHGQEGIGCSECHGGNPGLSGKKKAHGSALIRADDLASPVNYKNIPATCSECHDDYYQSFLKSKHYKKLVVKNGSQRGPNCVTCHASVNTTVLNVNTVRETCELCHNKKTDNHPEIPERAELLLNKFLSIHRFYRYITIKSDVLKDRKIFTRIEEMTNKIFIDWHTFNLPVIEKRTQLLLDFLKKTRNKIRNRERKK